MLSKLIQDWKNLTLFPNTQMPYLCCAFKSSIYVNWIWFRFLACMKFECVWNMTNHICAGIQMKHGLTMPHVWEEGSFVKQISERVRCLLASPIVFSWDYIFSNVFVSIQVLSQIYALLSVKSSGLILRGCKKLQISGMIEFTWRLTLKNTMT